MRVNVEGKNITVPDSYIEKQRKALGLSLPEIVEMFLSDEGLRVDPSVAEMTAKAKSSGVGAKATGERKERKAPVRKPDEVKRALMSALFDYIASQDGVEGAELVNPERQIAFAFGNDAFELTLTKKRKPKE